MNGEAGRCGYSKCRAELPGPGMQGGRPRSFCRDTRWEGGRTCAQLARAEREALGALGLDAGSTTFRLDADRLREQLDDVRGPVEALTEALLAVTTRLDEVEAAAVASVEAAHLQVAEAERARLVAEDAREQAEERSRQRTAAAERAAKERGEAVDRATAAGRQALEATEALGAAHQRAEEASAARRAAEIRSAQEAERATGLDQQLRELAIAAERALVERDHALGAEAEHRSTVEVLRAEIATERQHSSAALAQQARAETALVAAQEVAVRAAAAHETLRTQLAERASIAEQRAADSAAEIETLRARPTSPPRLHPADLQAMVTALDSRPGNGPQQGVPPTDTTQQMPANQAC